MATLLPFKALYFNPLKFKDLSDLIIPPYDNIPAGDDKKYLAKSPYNFAHVLLPTHADDDYSLAKTRLGQWRENHILVEDDTPGFYLYEQTFKVGNHAYRRDTLMTAVLLHDFKEAIIRPHENTYQQYKADRLRILSMTETNLSHIFGMAKDPQGELKSIYDQTRKNPPLMNATLQDVSQRVWRISDTDSAQIQSFFKDKPIYIVDGHHRYESSLQYARQKNVVGQPNEPAASMLFAIASSNDPALLCLPTHRLIKQRDGIHSVSPEALKAKFELSPTTEEAIRALTTHPVKIPRFALYQDGKAWMLTPKNPLALESDLGTLAMNSIVWSDHHLMADHFGINESNRSSVVQYERDFESLWAHRATAAAIIFHAPLSIANVTDVADEKRFLPQKSTFFYPKIVTGLVMRRH